jgi:uncharacterized protein (DUF2062 family)
MTNNQCRQRRRCRRAWRWRCCAALQFSYFTNNTATDAAQSTDDCRFGGGAVLLDYSNQSHSASMWSSPTASSLGNVATKGCGGGVLLNSVAPGVVVLRTTTSVTTTAAGRRRRVRGRRELAPSGAAHRADRQPRQRATVVASTFASARTQLLHSVVELNIAKRSWRRLLHLQQRGHGVERLVREQRGGDSMAARSASTVRSCKGTDQSGVRSATARSRSTP